MTNVYAPHRHQRPLGVEHEEPGDLYVVEKGRRLSLIKSAAGVLVSTGANATPSFGQVPATALTTAFAAWASWTPTVTSGTGTITTVGTVTARYLNIGKNLWFRISITITTNGTGATDIRFTLPNSLLGNGNQATAGRENQTTGKMLQCLVSDGSNTARLYNYDNSYPAGDGAVMLATGVVEVQ